jgi:hypothetical protein
MPKLISKSFDNLHYDIYIYSHLYYNNPKGGNNMKKIITAILTLCIVFCSETICYASDGTYLDPMDKAFKMWESMRDNAEVDSDEQTNNETDKRMSTDREIVIIPATKKIKINTGDYADVKITCTADDNGVVQCTMDNGVLELKQLKPGFSEITITAVFSDGIEEEIVIPVVSMSGMLINSLIF